MTKPSRALTKMDKTSPSAGAARGAGQGPRRRSRRRPTNCWGSCSVSRRTRCGSSATGSCRRSTPRARPAVLRGAYGALMIADGKPDQAWEAALKHDGHLVELLRSVPHLGNADLRAALFTPIAALAGETKDAATRAEALAALGWTRRDAATFDLLAQAVIKDTDPESRAAADSIAAAHSRRRRGRRARSSRWREPSSRWSRTPRQACGPSPRRSTRFSWARSWRPRCPADAGRAVRRDLRAMGVQIVRITTVPEQMIFDVKWFAVEAGKPVQIVLENPDAMPHNLLVGQPGSAPGDRHRGDHDAAAGGSGGQAVRPGQPARAAGHEAAQRRRDGRASPSRRRRSPASTSTCAPFPGTGSGCTA